MEPRSESEPALITGTGQIKFETGYIFLIEVFTMPPSSLQQQQQQQQQRTSKLHAFSYYRVRDDQYVGTVYFTDVDILNKTLMRLAWHLASDWPIEYYKCDLYAIKYYRSMTYNAQAIINSLLHKRYSQDMRTSYLMLPPLTEDRVLAAPPEYIYEFKNETILEVIEYLNMIVERNNHGFMINVSMNHGSVLNEYNPELSHLSLSYLHNKLDKRTKTVDME